MPVMQPSDGWYSQVIRLSAGISGVMPGIVNRYLP